MKNKENPFFPKALPERWPDKKLFGPLSKPIREVLWDSKAKKILERSQGYVEKFGRLIYEKPPVLVFSLMIDVLF